MLTRLQKFMGFSAKNVDVKNQSKKRVEKQELPTKKETLSPLTKTEIIWLMGLIKSGTFKGEDVQTVYETVVKLQIMLNQS
jgi:hypothetical protein